MAIYRQKTARVHRLRQPDQMLGMLLAGTATRIAENVNGRRHDDEPTLRALRKNLGKTLRYVDEWLGKPSSSLSEGE
jgi:hypothetical protein